MPQRQDQRGAPDEQPLELILARNLISIITLAAVLVDVDGHIVFYNDAAAVMIGARFEETGSLAREQWNAEFGPLDEQGRPLDSDRLALTVALREGRAAYGALPHPRRARAGRGRDGRVATGRPGRLSRRHRRVLASRSARLRMTRCG